MNKRVCVRAKYSEQARKKPLWGLGFCVAHPAVKWKGGGGFVGSGGRRKGEGGRGKGIGCHGHSHIVVVLGRRRRRTGHPHFILLHQTAITKKRPHTCMGCADSPPKKNPPFSFKQFYAQCPCLPVAVLHYIATRTRKRGGGKLCSPHIGLG